MNLTTLFHPGSGLLHRGNGVLLWASDPIDARRLGRAALGAESSAERMALAQEHVERESVGAAVLVSWLDDGEVHVLVCGDIAVQADNGAMSQVLSTQSDSSLQRVWPSLASLSMGPEAERHHLWEVGFGTVPAAGFIARWKVPEREQQRGVNPYQSTIAIERPGLDAGAVHDAAGTAPRPAFPPPIAEDLVEPAALAGDLAPPAAALPPPVALADLPPPSAAPAPQPPPPVEAEPQPLPPAPVDAPAPPAAPAPLDQSTPPAAPAPLDQSTPPAAPAPLDQPASLDTPAPLNQPAPLDTPAPLDQPVPHSEPPPQVLHASSGDPLIGHVNGAPPDPGSVVIELDNGERFALESPLVIGRSPGADAVVDGQQAHIVIAEDAERTVSRTHLAVHVGDSQVSVVDLNSSNGSIHERNGVRSQLVPNSKTIMLVGDKVWFGDRWLTLASAE